MTESRPYLIVGAGPTGTAAAVALTAAGQRAVVLDAGLTLEPERDAARRRMAATEPARWSPADVALTRFSAARAGGAGYKQLFGSDVAFRDDGALELHAPPEVAARPSYALGGLSNVWGAGVLPYTEDDLSGWPITAGELSDAYRAVFSFVPYAAEEDELAERYPLHAPPDGPLLRSHVAEQLLARLRAHAPELALAGYHFGASRLAVRVGSPAPAHGCCYCGHCLDGCPYGHIYNAGDTIAALARQGLIDYRPGLHVERVGERDGEATVEASTSGGGRVRLQAARVFLAAGAVSSTIILQRSGLLPERTEILDSQTLYLPFLWLGRVGKTGREPGHTLAQAFIVLDDPDVCAHPVHISLYTYNDGLNERARMIHPHLSTLLGPALEAINRRVVVGICFLHSDESQRIESSVGQVGRDVRLAPRLNPATPAALGGLQRALLRSLGPLGLIPLAPLAERAAPGGGFHSGCSLPMRARPTAGEADTLGRPFSTRRIHVVDACCFPSIPSGTVTLTAMANAYRIAREVLREERARGGDVDAGARA